MTTPLSSFLSWLTFVWSTVLPVAFRELLHWVYDWQILITGVLALAAAHVWGRSVIRAARIGARARNSDLRSNEVKRETAFVEPTPLSPHIPQLQERLFALRELIRTTLGKMPCTDEILTEPRQVECCKIADYPLGELPPDASKALGQRFEALRNKLAALKAVRETDTCRNAWEALVRISMDARDLMGEEPAKVAG